MRLCIANPSGYNNPARVQISHSPPLFDEIKTKALRNSWAFFVKYDIGQGLTGLDEKGIEKTKT